MKLDVGEFLFRQAGVRFADKVFARFNVLAISATTRHPNRPS
jgi:hypothetical protein